MKIEQLPYPVHLGYDLWREIEHFLQRFANSGGIYILTDTNTHRDCLRILQDHIPLLADQPSYSILPGEMSKDLWGLEKIWTWLMKSGAGRDSLLINLGGGVVSDLGGFAAATYHRGMAYINIPTSLIAQVDASIGGKTGLNIAGIKNQAGLFYNPTVVFIIPEFLDTLPDAHFNSGRSEIIKCAILSGKEFWELLKYEGAIERNQIFRLITETINFKCRVVAEDPSDRAIRKILNFGHTLGHALESLYNNPGGDELLHGYAVASGMICETYLSYETRGLNQAVMDDIISLIKSFFDLKPIGEDYFNQLVKIIELDKKKSAEGIGFSLIESIGKPLTDQIVYLPDLRRSIEYYNRIVQK